MNMRRGLFRVWLVLSAAWIVIATAILVDDFNPATFYLGPYPIPLMLLGPPAILVLAAALTVWIVDGFRSPHHPFDPSLRSGTILSIAALAGAILFLVAGIAVESWLNERRMAEYFDPSKPNPYEALIEEEAKRPSR